MKNQVSEHASEMIPQMMRRATVIVLMTKFHVPRSETAALGEKEKRPEVSLHFIFWRTRNFSSLMFESVLGTPSMIDDSNLF